MIRKLWLALCVGLVGEAARAACGAEPATCQIATGAYHIELPQRNNPPLVIFLHGYGGSASNVMKNRALVDGLLVRGYAVLAPEGMEENGRRSWNFYPGGQGRDETRFLTSVVEDAYKRFGIDADRVVLSGFSAGGFMVNYLACATPDAFSAYAPVSGGFWRPHPDSCAGPVRLFHTHGWTDAVVPLEGRYLGGGQFQQGDIFTGLEIWRGANGCVDNIPDAFSETGQFMRRKWTRCAEGSALELALFPGGHGIPEGWADMFVDWYEGLPGG
ncbi:polyhydroxybutyrate depolymerase [Ruegeria sediminis]|uniref:Polyhydroxybutyrate depolymerase n=1 Tax=Ruegeria sediminis TaxID=2583820 RepID=A0ABY2X4A0_9RHOB|nr:PHB depolymerase family esterase [Ruegeria sediminis]TMV09642.1 polyhydroxybutyrate depolymerase [Ruegeria sediminis]